MAWIPAGTHASSIHGAGSVSGSTSRMDHSFVVLPKQRPQAQGLPPRPQQGGPLLPDPSPSGRAMDESFVVVYKNELTSDGGAGQLPASDAPHGAPLPPNSSGFNATITVLKCAFEIATTQTQVNYEALPKKHYPFWFSLLWNFISSWSDVSGSQSRFSIAITSPYLYLQVEQPLCLECMRVLSDKLDKEVEDVKRDIEAYEACLQQMEGEPCNILSEADFLKEKLKVQITGFSVLYVHNDLWTWSTND